MMSVPNFKILITIKIDTNMNINNIDKNRLQLRMLFVKINTLMYYLPDNEVKKIIECDYEFDATGDTCIPNKLHIWIGNNHNYNEKYHKEFDVPKQFQLPLVA